MSVRRRPRLVSEINVVPYIDVMLVLLIIFMITAPLLQQGVDVDLPQAAAEEMNLEDHEALLVNVDREGRYYVTYGEYQGQLVDSARLKALTAAVLQRQPKTQVVVGGDRTVEYGQVVGAMVLLQQAGAPKVGLLTDTPES